MGNQLTGLSPSQILPIGNAFIIASSCAIAETSEAIFPDRVNIILADVNQFFLRVFLSFYPSYSEKMLCPNSGLRTFFGYPTFILKLYIYIESKLFI